ncbi:MAG: hypothetical protein EA398_05550 [Deltaproteobacteria bacterium]|nr:MAG: hypothetical protein EA398_05550 [Deltaproteobacteria bacterium]
MSSACRILGLATLLLLLAAPASASTRLEPAVITVQNTRFSIDAPRGMAGFVREAARVIENEWSRVQESIGAPDGELLHVHIETDLHDWFRREGLPARSPEWAAGLAIPSRRVILLAPRNPEWERTMVHELSHVAVAIAAGDARVPRWFDEGQAVQIAEQYGLDRATVLLRANVLGRHLDFAELENGFPHGAATAELAYAQSTALVRFILEAHGDDVFRYILRDMRENGWTWEHAFLHRTGRSTGSAYAAWEEQVRSRARWIPVAAGGGMAWTLLAFLFLWVLRRKRARDRARLAEMERAEARIFDFDPDDATFGATSD